MIKKHIDNRGQLVVFVKNKKFGQVYFVTFNRKGTVRGNHYHKKWREWCGIITGRIQVELMNIKTFERESFILDENDSEYKLIEIKPYIVHSFLNLTPKASLLNYADKLWSKKDDYKVRLL